MGFQPRIPGHRTCRQCTGHKPLAEFSEISPRYCQDCVDARKPAMTKAQRNRARNRAYAKLAQRHKAEFDELYEEESRLMRAQNGIAEVMAGLR